MDRREPDNAAASKKHDRRLMGQQRTQQAELLQIPFVKKVADVLGSPDRQG